jgi:hypothetical protein
MSVTHFSSSCLSAQSSSASLTGRVTDPSKAAIAEASIATIRMVTNFHYQTITKAAANTL